MPKLAAKKQEKKTTAKPGAKTKKTIAPKVSKISGVSVPVVGIDGKLAGKMTLPSELFAAKINKTLLSQAVRVYLANQREGAAATKTRGEVEGSTRKIYRQKGTGRARHGGIRAPIFVGGGIVFGPKPRNYSLKLPKKMKLQALASALTGKFTDGKIKVVEGLADLPPKTREMAKTLTNLQVEYPLLLVTAKDNAQVVRAARNISGVELILASSLNPYTVLAHQTLIFTKEALALLKDTFAR